MQQLVEERFPLLDDEEVARVYKSVIDMVSQEHVRTFFMIFLKNNYELLKPFLIFQNFVRNIVLRDLLSFRCVLYSNSTKSMILVIINYWV